MKQVLKITLGEEVVYEKVITASVYESEFEYEVHFTEFINGVLGTTEVYTLPENLDSLEIGKLVEEKFIFYRRVFESSIGLIMNGESNK